MVTQMVAKVMVDKGVHDAIVADSIVVHVSNATAKITLRVDKPMVVKAMKMANKRVVVVVVEVVADHVKDAITANQEPAAQIR